MAELPDVSPGEIIASAHINDVADRTAQRYQDQATLDIQNPTPEEGELAYLSSGAEDRSQFLQFDGAVWREVYTAPISQILTVSRSGTLMVRMENLLESAGGGNGRVQIQNDNARGFYVSSGSQNGVTAQAEVLSSNRARTKVSGIGAIALEMTRDDVVTQWRFAISSGTQMLLQSSQDGGNNWDTVETWVAAP